MTRNDVKDFISELLNDEEEVREWRDGVDGCSWKIEKEGDTFHLYLTGINTGKIKPRYIASFYDAKSFLEALGNAWGENIATRAEWIDTLIGDEEDVAEENAYWDENYPYYGTDDLFLLDIGRGDYIDIERLIY